MHVAGIAGYLLFQNARLGLVACGATPLVALVAALRRVDVHERARAGGARPPSGGAEGHRQRRAVKAFANEYESRRYDRAGAVVRALHDAGGVTGGYYALVYSFCSQLLVPAALLAWRELVLKAVPAQRSSPMLYQQQLQEYVGNLLDAVTSMYKSSGAASAAFALIDRAARARVRERRGRRLPRG